MVFRLLKDSLFRGFVVLLLFIVFVLGGSGVAFGAKEAPILNATKDKGALNSPIVFEFDFKYSVWERRIVGERASVSSYIVAVDLNEEKDRIRESIVRLSLQQVGKRYVYDDPAPPESFNCSVLVEWVYSYNGFLLPAPSFSQWDLMELKYMWHSPSITLEEIKALEAQRLLLPGDVLFFVGDGGQYPSRPGHVGIYVGGGKFVEAKGAAYGVVLSDLWARSDFIGFGSLDPILTKIVLNRFFGSQATTVGGTMFPNSGVL